MAIQQLTLRQARRSDLSLLRYWDEQPHVLSADPNDDWNWETALEFSPPWREQWLAELNGTPIGFIQVIDPALEETHYWGNVPHGLKAIDIWIGEARNLGKGYGTEMMRLAIARCFNDPLVTAIIIDPLASNLKAHKFYERLGFNFIREEKFGNDHCFVFQLNRQDWYEK